MFSKFTKTLNVKNQTTKIFKMEKNGETFHTYCTTIMNHWYLVKFKHKRNIIWSDILLIKPFFFLQRNAIINQEILPCQLFQEIGQQNYKYIEIKDEGQGNKTSIINGNICLFPYFNNFCACTLSDNRYITGSILYKHRRK